MCTFSELRTFVQRKVRNELAVKLVQMVPQLNIAQPFGYSMGNDDSVYTQHGITGDQETDFDCRDLCHLFGLFEGLLNN